MSHSLQKRHNQPDKDINYSDIPELDSSFWDKAKVVKPVQKVPVSLRVDKDVLAWFKAQGKGYQSLMNAVLKSYKTQSSK